MTRPDTQADTRLCVGALAGAFGVKGLARIKSFTADPFAIAAYGPVETEDGTRQFDLRVSHEVKPGVLVADLQAGLNREEVEALKGVKLYVARDALPEPEDEDEFYLRDLIGLEARRADGSVLGSVLAVPDFGAGDLLDIRLEGSRKTVLIPFTRACVPVVKIGEGFVTVIPPPGLLDEDDGTQGGK